MTISTPDMLPQYIGQCTEAELFKSHLRKFGKWESKTNVVFFLAEK